MVSRMSTDVAKLSWWLQCILIWIHQYRVHTIYKPCPDAYIADYLYHNNHKDKDQEIEGIKVNMNTISTSVNIPMCKSMGDIQTATCEDVHLEELKAYIIQHWPHKKEEVAQDIRQYWPLRNKLAMIDDIIMKDQKIIIPCQ